MSDNGLGYFATCTCPDVHYREHRKQTQEDILSRSLSANKLRTNLAHVGLGKVLRVIDSRHIATKYEVIVSQGVGQRGPFWYCKHRLASIRDAMMLKDGFFVLFFSRPDVVYPGLEAVSVDGWLQAIIVK